MTRSSDHTEKRKSETIHSEFVEPSRPGGYEGVRQPISVAPVQPTSTPLSDSQLVAEVIRRLEEEGRLERAELKVSSNGGVVTLEGRVPSEFTRGLAKAVAESSPGVLLVEENLRVKARPSGDR